MKKIFLALFGLAVAGALTVAGSPAQARVRAGLLRCHVSPGVAYVVGSQRDVSCTFRSVTGWREHYTGRITRVGFDIGYTRGGEIVWAVYAPARRGRDALAGTYLGASGEATIGAGVAANVLVGGSRHSITLQPLSVGAQEGFDLAVTASGLELEPAR
jgi:hypothetical protein